MRIPRRWEYSVGFAAVPAPVHDAPVPVSNNGASGQGLTLVAFSAQLEPCLTHKNTLHTLNTPLTWATQPQRAPPMPYNLLKLS